MPWGTSYQSSWTHSTKIHSLFGIKKMRVRTNRKQEWNGKNATKNLRVGTLAQHRLLALLFLARLCFRLLVLIGNQLRCHASVTLGFHPPIELFS